MFENDPKLNVRDISRLWTYGQHQFIVYYFKLFYCDALLSCSILLEEAINNQDNL